MGVLVADIFVDRVVYAIDKPYSYLVPAEMADSLRPGCRVLVPFGTGGKKVQGIVFALSRTDTPSPRLKQVAVQLDASPALTGEGIRLVNFLRETTFCTCYEAVRTVLPPGGGAEVRELYQLTSAGEQAVLSSDSPEKKLAEFLRTPKTAVEVKAFLGSRKAPEKSPAMERLLADGLAEKAEQIRRRISPKTVRMVRPSGLGSAALSKKQGEVLAALKKLGSAQVKELCYQCGVTESVVKALAAKQAVEYFEQEAEPVFSAPRPPEEKIGEIRLSPEQERVYQGLLELTRTGSPQAALLYGVTGSGKTQVYIKLIEQIIAQKKSALLLVPEIALTPQIVGRFEGVFGGIVAVIHSGLSPAERLSEWNRIQSGQVRIVIGTRSAVFAPLTDLGLIILDEEGEGSYKSESAPRYHARDVAKLRCTLNQALLLLGSATPSVDSYYRAQRGDYRMFSLQERFSGEESRGRLPQVYLVDMQAEQKEGNLSSISRLLGEQLALNLQAGEQSILLMNRRGYHTFAACMQCGQVLKCPRCDVAMTYHRANERLMCHYCGYSESFHPECPSCGGAYIKLTGAGTQRLEEELRQWVPAARILRMDADTTYSRYSYERNFEAFRRGNYDVMLGTQMIAKGLDFPNVTLVGVTGADSGLYAGDFRASERVFSLITQVVGRSGRGEKPGRAYIQTLDTENPVILFAANQDYPGFYKDEITARKALLYPPFCDMVALGFSGPREEAVRRAACRAMEVLRQAAAGQEGIALKVLGITPAAVSRVNNRFRYRILIKCRLNGKLRSLLAGVLRRCGQEKVFAGVSLFADVNGELL